MATTKSEYRVRRVIRNLKTGDPALKPDSFAQRIEKTLNDLYEEGYDIFDIKVGNADAIVIGRDDGIA